MRGPRLSLILAICLALTGCRTPGEKVTIQPLSPPPSKTDPPPTNHGQNDIDPKKSGQPDRPHEAKTGNDSLAITEVASNRQQTVSLRPPGTQDNKPPAISGNTNLNNAGNMQALPRPAASGTQTAPNASSALKLPVPDRTQNSSGAKTNLSFRPTLGSTLLPVNASNDDIPMKAFSINLWQPLTSSTSRAGTAVPLAKNPATGQTSINNLASGIELPLVERSSYNASPGNETPAPVLPMAPLLEDVNAETQRRARVVSQKEAERKMREAERDKFNRAFYQFFLGK